MSEVRRTQWVIEGKSNLSDVGSDMERIISLLKQQNDLTRQQTTQTLLATQQQREAIENVGTALTKQNTRAKTEISTLRSEYDLFQKTLTGLTQLLAGAWIVGQVKDYVQEVIKAKSAQDLFVVSLENMLKSKVQADQINAQLMAIALRSPFEVEQIQEVTKKLVGMGVEVNKIIPYITMLGEISAVVGTSKLPLIAKAFTDVSNKGILMGQEIKQFAENGIPIFDLLADSMGKARDEVVKLADAHKITFQDVEKALMKATTEGGRYYGQMAAQAGTLAGQVSNLKDRYTLAQAAIGDFFEDTLKGGISTMADLIHETIGSQAAIQRLVDSVKAAASAYVTYRAAVLTVSSAKRAAAAETVALAVAETAATAGTVSLTGAWNALKVAFVTNPIGAVITAVGALATAFYSYKALTAEVTYEQNQQSDALRKSNKEFEIATAAVMQHKEGTNEYKQAVEKLIARYPEYFAGIEKESINNRVLNGVLMDVNGSFQERIRLANLAYKADALTQKAIELDREQLEVIRELRQEYEGISKLNPNDEAFLNAVKNQQGAWEKLGNFIPGILTGGLVESDIFQAGDIINAKKKIEAELVKIKDESEKQQTIITARSLDQQIQLLIKQLNQKEITQKEFDEKYLELTGQTVKKTVDLENDGNEKKGANHKKHLDKKLKDIETAEQAAAKIKIDYDNLDLIKMERRAAEELKVRNTLADDIIDLTEHNNNLILKEEEEKAQRIAEIGQRIFEIQKELNEGTIRLGEMAAIKDKKIWQDKEKVVLNYYKNILNNELDLAKKQESAAQEDYNNKLLRYGPDNELTKASLENLKKAQLATQQATEAVAANTAAIAQYVVDKIIEIAQAAMQVVNMLAQNYIETTREAADSLDTVAGYIDKYVDANRKALQDQLSDVKLTNEQREKAIDESLNRESQLVKRKSAMLEMRDQLTDIAERTENTMEMVNQSLDTVVKFAKGDFVGGMLGVIESINMAFNRQAMEEIQQEMKVLREKQRNAQTKIQLIEAEIAARKKQLEEEIKDLDEGYKKWKEVNDKKAADATQASEDQQLRVQNDDNFRAKILKQAEERDIKLLEAARDRELKRASDSGATAEELADIKNSFEVLIAETHKKYEDAKKDKTLAVSLAIQGIKNLEKDKLAELKQDEKNEFDRVEDLKKDKTAEFANFAQGAHAAIFDQQKNLAILEIRMEIAKLKAQKRKLFANKRALDAAIGEMEGLINEITGGGGNVADDWGSGGGGDNTGGDNTGGNTGGTGNPGDEEAAPKFHGDPWIKRRNGEPYGLDTILARLHEGERVVGSYLNSLVGPTVSNKELIEGYLNFKNLNLNQPTLKSLYIPVTDTKGTAADVVNIELQREIRGLRNALSGKMTQVNIFGVDGIGRIVEAEKTAYNQKLNQ